jgi:hypothetical protein
MDFALRVIPETVEKLRDISPNYGKQFSNSG